MAMAAQSRAVPVILTRPADQGREFARDVSDRFGAKVAVIESPLIAPRYHQPVLEGRPWTAVIFTSRTAVAATVRLGEVASTLPRKAFCVGDRTADAAREAGFEAVSAKGNAEALHDLILAAKELGPLLHLRGQDAAGDLAQRLSLAGLETKSAVVYSEEARSVSAEAAAVLSSGRTIILPVFSPRTASILARELAALPRVSPLVIIAISPATLHASRNIPSRSRIVAERPDAVSMLAAIDLALIAMQAT